MIEHATETLGEAAEAMDAIYILASLAACGTPAQAAAALAEIARISFEAEAPLAELAKELVDIEKGVR